MIKYNTFSLKKKIEEKRNGARNKLHLFMDQIQSSLLFFFFQLKEDKKYNTFSS